MKYLLKLSANIVINIPQYIQLLVLKWEVWYLNLSWTLSAWIACLLNVCEERKHEIVSVLSVYVYIYVHVYIGTCILYSNDKTSSAFIDMWWYNIIMLMYIYSSNGCDNVWIMHRCVMWIYLESFDHVKFICFTLNTQAN